MDRPTVGTNLCEHCSLLRFDDLAVGCIEVVDNDGLARLSFAAAEIEWRPPSDREEDDYDYKLLRLGCRWHLDDSLPDMPQLSKSSQLGCGFCNSLRLSLEKYVAEQSKDHFVRDGPIALDAYLSLRMGGVEGLVVEVAFNQDEDGEECAMVFFPIEASPGESICLGPKRSKADAVFQSCQKWLGAEPVRHDSYLTAENTNQIFRMLTECTTTCHPWKAASFLPTRLIDVGTSSSDTPRLVVSSDLVVTAETKYAALSYCWGDEEDAKTQLKTEESTLEQRLGGIPCEKMTPAIKDAVDLTREIGLRYVWIDTLCIVQDDTADWSYESGQMNRVFRHAFVTFCGLASTSCHESFLQRARAVTFPFQSTLQPKVNGCLTLRLQPVSGDWRDREIFSCDRSTSRWDQRAWTFQEEKLSTRLLFFGGSKMHFRCGMYEWSEGYDKPRRLPELSGTIFDIITGIENGQFPVSSLHDTWNKLVHHYAPRLMTHNEDRLPAISGLAKLMSETLRDRYVAGLWKGDILSGLAWTGSPNSYGLHNQVQSIRERHYIAPSWSWAAFIGGGSMNICFGWETVPECMVPDVDVRTDPRNPFGRVYGGHLRIRGKVAPIPSLLREDGFENKWIENWWLLLDGYRRSVVGICACLDWRQGARDEGLENLVMLLLHHQRPPEQLNGGLSDSTNTSHSLQKAQARILRALILYPTEIAGEYYRVGIIESTGQAGYNIMGTWFENERDERICTII